MPFGSDPFRDAVYSGNKQAALNAQSPMPFGSDPFRDLTLGE